MTGNALKRLGLMSATMLTGFSASGAMAQVTAATAAADSAAATDAIQANDIVVTGTRRSTSLQDTPINISAITGEELSDKRIDDVRDLADFTPGVTIQDTGPRSTGGIVFRGLNADDNSTFGSNNDDAIATYLGETPLYLDLKLLDLQRVEVLRGPQGTLYGAGTLAGAIRYIPERPDATKWEGKFHGRMFGMSHSDDPGFETDAVLNMPIIKDVLALRAVVGYYDTPGFIDYPLLVNEPGVSLPQPGLPDQTLGTAEEQAANLHRYKDANFEHTFTSRLQAGIYPWEGASIYLTYAHQDTRTNGRQINGYGVLGTGKYEAPQRYLEPATRKSDLYSAEVEIDLGDFAQLVSATSYSKRNNWSSSDVTDLLIDLDYDYELFPAFAGYTDSRQTYEQTTQELRLVSTHGGPLSWVIGGFYNDLDYNSNYVEILPGIPEFYGIYRPDNYEYASYVKSKDKEKAIFGEATLEPIKGLKITGGLRYYKYQSEIDGGSALPLYQTYPEINYSGRSGDTSDDGLVWKANLSYEFSPELLVYGTYSTGYRIGGVNRVAPCVLPLPEGQNLCALPDELSYGPDKTKNAEIGARATLFNGLLSGSLDVYHIDWDGIQLAGQTVNGAIGITVNGGTAVSKGVELEFALHPANGLVIRGNYAYVDAHLTEDVPGLLQQEDQDGDGDPDKIDAKAGDRLPGSAKHSAALGATYTFSLSDNSEISANWTATYHGNVLSRVGARAYGEKIPDYTTHRAFIGWRKDIFSIKLYADNIFDKYAYTAVGEDLSRQIVNDGVVSRYYSRTVLTPRVIGLETNINF
ncbi:TonB-dependent receptor [Stakelama sp. CBK3Z-3]|uniref:TonB-dependent receptor n=1 Tax=Stakelama flava TaxID=2860338 RepID=A0ABS6XK33_9SPHN|nr:TonB-dependent receptor [Stakelama flava]MBW4330562.1 TonB-dependent receptor [Stakelama flava]